MVSTLIEGGANPLVIDNYGRTSLDWASMYRPCLEAMGDWAKNYTATSQSIKNARLNKTVTNLIGQIQDETVPASYYRLGHVLLLLGDLPAASIAFEQDMSERDGDPIHGARCNRCSQIFLFQECRYVCKSCIDADFCERCFKFFRNGTAFERCQNHEFIRLPRDVWKDLKRNCVDENGKTVQMWLAETYERYED